MKDDQAGEGGQLLVMVMNGNSEPHGKREHRNCSLHWKVGRLLADDCRHYKLAIRLRSAL